MGHELGSSLHASDDDGRNRPAVVEGMPLAADFSDALQALRSLQVAAQQSGVTEEELQAEARRIREELGRVKFKL